MHRAHRFGLAGASAFHGVEGFGSSSVVHIGHLMSISDQLPIVIVAVMDRLEAFLARLDGLIGLIDHGVITWDEVTAIRYAPLAESHRHR